MMTSQNRLPGFTLEELVSENNLCQSWLARHKTSGEPRFLKIQVERSEARPETLASIIVQSYECQRRLRSPMILTALRRHNMHGRVVIEYPFLDGGSWSSLSADWLIADLNQLLPEIAIIIDFVHFSGYVHCDLKLGNFMVNRAGQASRLTLVDLDFMRPDGTAAEATILGTPEHIAPEIRADEEAVVQSDMYSIGISFRKAIEEADAGALPDETLDSLRGLIDDLTHPGSYERPLSLLDALHERGLISGDHLLELNRRLLTMLLRSILVVNRRDLMRGRADISSLLKDIRVLGLSPEFVGDSKVGFAESAVATLRAWRQLIKSAEVERFGRYWAIKPEDAELLRAYQTMCSKISNIGEGHSALVRQADELEAEQQYEKCFLLLKRALAKLEAEDSDRRLILLQRLQNLAAKLHRTRDVVEFIEASTPLQSGVNVLESSYLLVRLYFALGRYDDAAKTIYSLIEQAQALGESQWKLRFEAVGLLYDYHNPDRTARKERLEEIELEAGQLGHYSARVAARYNIGCLQWFEGNHSGALESVSKALGIAKAQGLDEQSFICTIFLARLHSELGRYAESQKLIDRGLRQTRTVFNLNAVSQLLTTCVGNLCRMGKLDAAMLRNEESISLSGRLLSIESLLSCLLSRAEILIHSGDLTAATSQLHECRSLKGEFWSHRNHGWLHHLGAMVAVMQGRREECRRHLDLGHELYPSDDRAALLELDFLGCLDRMLNGGDDCADDLMDLQRELATAHTFYFSTWAALHLCLSGRPVSDVHDRNHLLELSAESPDVPLFRAVSILARDAGNCQDCPPSIPALKEVLQTFDLKRSKLIGLHICMALGREYLKSGRETMAVRYYEAALRLARALNNRHLIERLTRQLEELEKSSSSQRRLIDSVRGISDVLSRTAEYRDSLRSLVSFAVEHTGAERGVLLLRNEGSTKLRAVASVNCDDLSCTDIERFSSSIPGMVARSAKAIVVDNAQADQRTAGFQSIVAHNILSVICVPVDHQGDTLGALYLDHHSVPSLFQEQDLAWIETVANFVGVALAASQNARKLRADRQRITQDLEQSGHVQDFITIDPNMKRMLEQLPNIANSSAPVLILGEPGTGKEILADMIHRQSPRAEKPFLKMNCAAIPKDMAESELFGVTKGAATGVSEREGKLSAADEGTLLLDEIGDMPLPLQAKLLRAVEYKSFEPVGSNRTVHVDIRFLYATNKDLGKMVANGQFRPDLLDRMQVIRLQIAPLRERPGDIPVLLDHFTRLLSTGQSALRFTEDALAVLRSYRWPGNVRELRNVVEHCAILYPDGLITPEMLPLKLDTGATLETKEAAEAAEANRIRHALVQCNWNKSQAARLLGMHVSSFRRRMKRHGIER